MRALFLSAALAFAVPVVALAPSTAHALEQDGVHKATYNSIMKCDVDIRREIQGDTEPGGASAAIQAALDAVEGNRDAATGGGAKRLAQWAGILRKGKKETQAAKGADRVAALRKLRKQMAPMVAEAKEATGK